MKSTTLAESSEILRMSLPLMGKYTVPVTPANYAVWYEYVSGDNIQLKSKIDNMIAGGNKIDDSLTKLLYKEYIDPVSSEKRAEKTRFALDAIASSLTTTIQNASGDVNRYEKSLEGYESQINKVLLTDEIKPLVADLSGLARDMQKGNDAILEELAEARTEAENLRKELQIAKNEAKIDPLTELANRKAFFDYVEEMKVSGKVSEKGHCVLMIDIDNFKRVNDNYGHLFGDKVIKIVATIMKKLTKGKDMAARFGGEEFIILLPDTDVIGGKSVAESIRKTMEEGRIVKPKTGEAVEAITLSVGVAGFNLVEKIEESIQRADEALYLAKENGRNRVEIIA